MLSSWAVATEAKATRVAIVKVFMLTVEVLLLIQERCSESPLEYV